MKRKNDKEKNEIIDYKEPVNLKNKIKKKESKQKKVKQEKKNYEDKLLRNIADLQNQLKRNEKNCIFEKNKLRDKFLIQIVDLLELIKKAYSDKNSKSGIKLIINNIENFLKDENVTYIDCIGKSFDHKIHHAVTTIEKKDCEDETIIDELKKGYYVNNELLRPSQVIVSKKIKK